mmetsp:Transcript_1802/g.2594  ORF Transcript_1802/g.2594 Transcript_1802/m.2594 type:complete len:233 (+) Transcript_1802:54-752(+)
MLTFSIILNFFFVWTFFYIQCDAFTITKQNKGIILSHQCYQTISSDKKTCMNGMKRPIIDQIASTLFKLEKSRVDASSIVDEKGRVGEPMEWSEKNSLPNQFSEIIASNTIGYKFKQWVADIIAGDYDKKAVKDGIQLFIKQNEVAMFSFTTCPYCRGAKDYLNERSISYAIIELDELEGNEGNEIRAVLGQMTGRTSVPSIFLNGEAIGGLNDGMPGLIPLAENGGLDDFK